jgi:hypothetical protein
MPDEEPADRPPPPPAPQPAKPPLLEYPSRPINPERDTEPWPDVFRAMLIVFGVLSTVLFIGFGLCGVLARGCS